jgi:serine beta-lactamase-like protein LACTB
MLRQTTRRIAWTVLAVFAIAGSLAVIAGLPFFVRAMATPLHPQPEDAPSVARPAPSPRWSAPVDRARRIVRAALADENLPGVSVAVGAGGEVVWAEGFGWSNVENHVPMTPDTRFRIGTASTALTSAAVGLLLEMDRLKLDEEIQTYVPQFPRKQQPVTLRQVMGHTGGVGTDDKDDRSPFRRRCERPVEALEDFADRDLLFEPGTQYRSSNYGWILASAAVEGAAGQPFLSFMREQIFQPLGMTGTGAESTTEENPQGFGEPGEDAPPITFVRQVILEPLGIVGDKPRNPGLATVYVAGFGPDPLFRHGLHVATTGNLSCFAGSMAFFSTPSDLVRFGLAIESGKLLQHGTVQLLQTPQRLSSGRETGHGLGWDIETVTLSGRNTQAVGGGAEPPRAAVVSMMTFRELGIVVAVMSNISHAETSGLALTVAESFAEQAGK